VTLIVVNKPKDARIATTSAILTAVLVIASQIAGKAARDAIFLSNYAIEDLPLMIMAAAAVSIFMMLLSARLMVRFGPIRLIPATFLVSAATLLGIWGLMHVDVKVAAILFYLHLAAFGVVLISGFWSLVNERFDPHTAKKTVSRIVAGATFGGLIGGVLAERLAAVLDVSAILPVLAGLHILCAWKSRDLAPPEGAGVQPDEQKTEKRRSSWSILGREVYLRNLAIIVITGTVAAALLDYVYKAYATETFGNPETLTRFFAWYYMGVGLITFGVQTLLSRRSLERLGLGGTVATLPFAVAAGSIGVIFAPHLFAATAARFSEAVLRNSLFRSAYELFFVPIPAGEKRATKTVIDVGFDRLGDAVGGGLIKLVLLIAPLFAIRILLIIAAVLAGIGLLVSAFLKRGYIKALEKSLVQKDVSEDLKKLADKSTDSMILRTLSNLNLNELTQYSMKAISSTDIPSKEAAEPASRERIQRIEDPLARRMIDLRSGNIEKVRGVLEDPEGLDTSLTPHVLPLLAWDLVYPTAIDALKRIAPKIIGQLTDAMIDVDEEFIIRRRIPLVLGSCRTQRAVDALFLCLNDKRFEVRFKCAKALSCIHDSVPDLNFDESKVYDAVLSELKADKHVWFDRKVLDQPGSGCEFEHFDEVIKDRTEYSLEHVFTLLSLVMEKKPLKVAFRGLHTTDEMLRGTALEYLDVTLTTRIRDAIWPLLGDHKLKDRAGRDRNKATSNLMKSSIMIDSNLAAYRKKKE